MSHQSHRLIEDHFLTPKQSLQKPTHCLLLSGLIRIPGSHYSYFTLLFSFNQELSKASHSDNWTDQGSLICQGSRICQYNIVKRKMSNANSLLYEGDNILGVFSMPYRQISFMTVYMVTDWRHEWRMAFHISYLIQVNTGILDLSNQLFYCDQWHLPKHRKVTCNYWPKELKTCILKTTKKYWNWRRSN